MGQAGGNRRGCLCFVGPAGSTSLWTAMQQAAAELAAAQGPDPTAWREPATRIDFIPGLIPETMRFTNRSTFQQVIRFARRP